MTWRHGRDRRVALSLGVVHRLVGLADRGGRRLCPIEQRATDGDGDRQRHPLCDQRRVADERADALAELLEVALGLDAGGENGDLLSSPTGNDVDGPEPFA